MKVFAPLLLVERWARMSAGIGMLFVEMRTRVPILLLTAARPAAVRIQVT